VHRAATGSVWLALLSGGGLIGGFAGDYLAAKTHKVELADERKRLEITLADERARIKLANEATATALRALTTQYTEALELCRR